MSPIMFALKDWFYKLRRFNIRVYSSNCFAYEICRYDVQVLGRQVYLNNLLESICQQFQLKRTVNKQKRQQDQSHQLYNQSFRFPLFWGVLMMRVSVSFQIYNIIELNEMRATHSRLERQQQVKVVIRLKPEYTQTSYNKCVHLSEQENQLVVSTDNKQEIFVFDHVAHQATSQLDIYRMIGQEAVQASLEGYNCCVFAYGQTGAGKTYSIMGDISQLNHDGYCESRGILPRLIQDIFQQIGLQTQSIYKISCSYIQIYNQQIFDLLSTDKRVHQIREDHRKGVFVEGVMERKLTSYRQGIDALLEGDKTRKIAYTSMNTQSSRSHVIFTLMIESQVKEDEIIKIKKSKLNIVDLAGSERVKHTNVEGQRLREGCNINKSLHVLGNVINSLVQSTKKKKHIPYRDSKLTYYLKDSLGGNSITKLLANVHCGKEYYGDTISTLMFAKRAKILKTRVELNENLSENFDSLRKQVKRLRQQLAEARYFKDIQKTERPSFYQDFQQTLQKITDNSDYEVAPKLQIIQVFEQNQLHYKSLIQIYEQHMKICNNHSVLRKGSLNIVGEWKNNQKKNLALTKLVNQFPAFTKIYKENILLKQDKDKNRNEENMSLAQEQKNISKKNAEQTTFITIKQPQNISPLASSNLEEIVKVYQAMIDQMNARFTATIQSFQKSYTELQHEVKIKDKRIRALIKAQDVPPDIEQLRNQNQYLHLNILNLQNEINQLRQNELRITYQKKQLKKSQHRISMNQKDEEQQHQLIILMLQKLRMIKQQAQKQAEKTDNEREQMQKIIIELRTQVASLMNQNNKLQIRYNRSGSHKKNRQMYQSQHFLQIIDSKSKQMSSLGQTQYSSDKNSFSVRKQFKEEDAVHTREIMTLRLQIKIHQKEIVDLKQQIQQFQKRDRQIQDEFGKELNDIVKDYRQKIRKAQPQLKSVKSITKYKELESCLQSPTIQNRFTDKVIVKKAVGDVRALLQKQTPRNKNKKQEQLNNYMSANHYKSKNNIKK